MATTNGSTAIRDKILASLARYRALRIGKFPCAFWRLSARPGLTADAAGLVDVDAVIPTYGNAPYRQKWPWHFILPGY
ncbi:hypothetical protein [Bathymodiolus japonicus methanotrophic gill symbiont]|uniref:hypothetical protein n=1 Tax=Bathymodiolus japonicus methanotrophic gill symbiont TaxID=113269 RepID=UPI001C8D5412|nr:hypothetical protein [Bathymodiolus japonicus methanotrophic gill symbiont]